MPHYISSAWFPQRCVQLRVSWKAKIPPIFWGEQDQQVFSVTWDQGPALHSGGQAWLLQTWTWVGVLTGQREWSTAASFWKGFFWTHWTFRLCWPLAHGLLHTLHSPGFQLSVKNKITSSETLAHHFQSSYCKKINHPMKESLRSILEPMRVNHIIILKILKPTLGWSTYRKS